MSGDSHDGDVQYDPFSDAVMADPTTAYRELLAQCPVPHYDSFDPPFWSLPGRVSMVKDHATHPKADYSPIRQSTPRFGVCCRPHSPRVRLPN